jgi:hypothetical protein
MTHVVGVEVFAALEGRKQNEYLRGHVGPFEIKLIRSLFQLEVLTVEC